jgi:hypothetical protein
MLRTLSNAPYLLLDHDATWWGIRRLRPAPDQPYTARTLLLVCLACGLPTSAIVYGAVYLALKAADPFGHNTSWLPRAAAWSMFVLNGLLQALGCWLWNWRAARLNPAAFRRVRPKSVG